MANHRQVDGLARLRKFVAAHGSRREAAAALGIGQAYLSDILRGNRLLSDTILGKLGLRRVVVEAEKAS